MVLLQWCHIVGRATVPLSVLGMPNATNGIHHGIVGQ
jgi:hypothetical protein